MELAVTREQTAVGTGRVELALGKGAERGSWERELCSLWSRSSSRSVARPCPLWARHLLQLLLNVPQCGAISRVKRSLPSGCCGQWTSLTRTRHNSRLVLPPLPSLHPVLVIISSIISIVNLQIFLLLLFSLFLHLLFPLLLPWLFSLYLLLLLLFFILLLFSLFPPPVLPSLLQLVLVIMTKGHSLSF